MNYEAFLQTLPIMGKGTLGIFIVTGVIILLMTALNKFSDNSDKKAQK